MSLSELCAFTLGILVCYEVISQLLCNNPYCEVLISIEILKRNCKTKVDGFEEIRCSNDKLSITRHLCNIQIVKRTKTTPPTGIRRVLTQPRIAEFISPQSPVNEKSQRGALGPLAAG